MADTSKLGLMLDNEHREFPDGPQPSPRPWREGPDLTILCANGSIVARLSSTRGKYEIEDENRKLIIRAVNALDDGRVPHQGRA